MSQDSPNANPFLKMEDAELLNELHDNRMTAKAVLDSRNTKAVATALYGVEVTVKSMQENLGAGIRSLSSNMHEGSDKLAESVDEFRQSVETASEASTRIAKKMTLLTRVLVILTSVLAVSTAVQAWVALSARHQVSIPVAEPEIVSEQSAP